MEYVTCLSSCFLDQLNDDYEIDSVLNALDETNNVLIGNMKYITDKSEFQAFFFEEDEFGVRKPNKNYDDLLSFWDVFKEFELQTKEARLEKWSGEPFIIKAAAKILQN